LKFSDRTLQFFA